MQTVIARFRRTIAAAGVVMLVACEGQTIMPDAIPIAEATAFLGHDLPTDASGVRAAGDTGVDLLVLLRFDTSTASAAFTLALTGGEAVAGSNPGLGYLGAGLDWWPAVPPAGSAGREDRTPANRTVKLLSTPGPGDRRTVYVAAFSQ